MTAERKAATVTLTSKWGSVVTVPAADENKYIAAGFTKAPAKKPGTKK